MVHMVHMVLDQPVFVYACRIDIFVRKNELTLKIEVFDILDIQAELYFIVSLLNLGNQVASPRDLRVLISRGEVNKLIPNRENCRKKV